MLLRNGHSFNANPGRFTGNISFYCIPISVATKPGSVKNFQAGDAGMVAGASVTNFSGFPVGYLAPTSWLLPRSTGGLSSHYSATGSGVVSAAIAGGLNGAAALTGSGAITDAGVAWIILGGAALVGLGAITLANANAVVPISSDLAGTSAVTASISAALSAAAGLLGSGDISAALIAVLTASADLTGSGDLTAAIAGAVSAVGALQGAGAVTAAASASANGSASLTGSSTTVAALQALGNLTAAIVGAGTITNAAYNAPADMSANITASGDLLTPANIATAVWNALVATYSGTAGSFAEAISQGSAGLTQQQIRDALTLAATLTPEDGSIDRLLTELWQLSGLDPTAELVVTPTTRVAGAVNQTIAASGTTVTVQRE